jgi:hypothetical protein
MSQGSDVAALALVVLTAATGTAIATASSAAASSLALRHLVGIKVMNTSLSSVFDGRVKVIGALSLPAVIPRSPEGPLLVGTAVAGPEFDRGAVAGAGSGHVEAEA